MMKTRKMRMKMRRTTENPTITTAMYNVDVALLQVKVAEGALYPTLQAVGNVQKNLGASPKCARKASERPACARPQVQDPGRSQVLDRQKVKSLAQKTGLRR
jgi:outer membrane protein